VSFNFLKKNATTRSYPTDILIGELFVKAGIITQKQLDDTARLAGTKHLHIGQMLVMSGFVKQKDLQAAVDAQAMMRDKLIDMNQATRCLKISYKTGASFEELVQEEISLGHQASTQTNRLGELLIDAGIITEKCFAAAMQRCLATGLPLGRILVLNGSIQDSLLRFSLELQVRVRDGMMNRQEAVDVLRREAAKFGAGMMPESGNLGVTTALKPLKQKQVRLGELVVLAGFLGETDVMSCLELGLMSDRPIGEIMVEQGYISGEMLNVALAVQNMIELGKYSRDEGGALLKQMQSTGIIVPDVYQAMNSDYFQASTQSSTNEYSYSSENDSAPSLEALMAAVGGAQLDSTSPCNDEFHQSDEGANGHGNELENDPLAEEFMRAMHHAEQPEMATNNGRGEAQGLQISSPSSSFNNLPVTAVSAGVGNKAAEPEKESVTDFEKLLYEAHVVTAEDIDRAFTMARANPLALVDLLRATGFLTDVGRQAALDCQLLIEKGDFALEHASQVLDHCINQGRLRNLTMEQSLFELGWTRPAEEENTAVGYTAADDAAPSISTLLASFGEPPNIENLSNQEFQAGYDNLESELVNARSDSCAVEPAGVMEEAVASFAPEEVAAELSPEPAQEDTDLLKLFGLNAGDDSNVSEQAEADVRSAQAGLQAEALMNSLAQAPRDELLKIEQEAAIERPESFETTAVFRAVDMEAARFDAQESAQVEATPDAGEEELSLSGLLSQLSASDEEPGNEPQELATPSPAPAAGDAVSQASAEEDVDLRSLFATFAPAQASVEPAPVEAPVSVVAASIVPEPVAPAPVVAPAAVVAASPVPEPVAPAPVVAPVPEPVSAVLASNPSSTANRLPKMTDAELAAAKAAQISSMAGALTKVAETQYEAGNYAEAQRAYERILSWRQGELGHGHIDLVDDLNNLAGVMCVQGNFTQAEPLIRRAVDILEGAEQPDPLRLAENLTSLAGLQFQLGVLDKAEPLLSKALLLREAMLGPNNPDLADSLRDYAKLLKKLGRLEEAEKYYMRAKVLLGKA
jgi:tetratricopeptide (TPR) repeat protein